jgi:hypothetical protein
LRDLPSVRIATIVGAEAFSKARFSETVQGQGVWSVNSFVAQRKMANIIIRSISVFEQQIEYKNTRTATLLTFLLLRFRVKGCPEAQSPRHS